MSNDATGTDTDPPSALPRGTRLGEFELLRVLGVGGFGIVYLAFDHALEREVAVKEYMPASLVGRTETLHVTLRSKSDSDTFALGLRSFVNEARLLARFDHPSLLKVLRFWESNGTAYMAMPVIGGRTLKEVRGAMTEPPTEAWLRSLLLPLLGAIERLHGEGVYHRDIAPDNIVIEADGRPVLLDFGAARRVIGDKSQSLTAILKPAYAPIEQYAESGSVRQGPWTDLYSLGATLHYMLLGRPPQPATARTIQDDQAPLSSLSLPGCSPEFLATLDWMLTPRPSERAQSVAAVRDVLEGRAPPPQPRAPPPPAPDIDFEKTQLLVPPTAARPTTSAFAGGGSVVVPRPRPAGASLQVPAASVSSSMAPVLPSPAPAPLAAAPVATPPHSAVPRLPDVPPPPAARSPAAAPPRDMPPQDVPPRAMPAAVASPQAMPAPVMSPPASAPPAAARKLSLVPVLAAVAAVAAAGGYFALHKPLPTVESAATAASAASAPVVAAAASPPAAVASAAPMAPPDPPPVAAAPAPDPVVVTQPVKADAPRREARAPKTQPVPSRPAEAEPVVVEAPKPPPPPPPPAAPPAEPAAPAYVPGPNERCGSRVLVALWLCIERQCAKPELRSHAECVKWRSDQERKANSQVN